MKIVRHSRSGAPTKLERPGGAPRASHTNTHGDVHQILTVFFVLVFVSGPGKPGFLEFPPGGPDGLPTGLLAPKTASARASSRLHDNYFDETSVRST